jgi:hopanoid biosynthesis associated protein HpnK
VDRRLIVTADDFGADVAVNEAVERGHREGILTAASLMVTGGAMDDAVARARAMPGLGVGLHLVLVEGWPALPARSVPDLVDREGRFRTDMARMGVDIFFRPAVRHQLAAEIEAQFARFAETGLPLDHVNAHKHFHLHPTIASLILKIGRRHGMRAARAPIEPRALLRRIEPGAAPGFDIAAPWAGLVRHRFVRHGLMVPDRVFGLAWSGAMDARRLAGLIAGLPEGLSEIYLHPASSDTWPGHAPHYRYTDELAALLDASACNAVQERGVRLGRFVDF